ncbi:MAG: sulfite exporter TauE/SafE family protein [Methyloligellaceae bacterium]
MFTDLAIPTDVWFYVVGYFAVGLIALTKAAFGGGIALIGIPVLALVMPPLEAAIILGPMFTFMDMFAIRAFRKSEWSKKDVFWLWPGVLAGTGLGALFFVIVNPNLVAATMGILTLLFCAHWYLSREHTNSRKMPCRPELALTAGAVSGFTSFIAHGGGPPVIAYMLQRGFDKTVYAGSLIIFFTLGNFIKAVPYLYLNLARPGLIWKSLVLLPVIPLAVWLGKVLHDRLPQKALYFWCYLLLTVAALKLTIDSIAALIKNGTFS